MAPVGRQQLRPQDLAPARRCGTEERTGHQGPEEGNGDRDGDGDGREDAYGHEHEGRDGGGNGSGSGNGREDEDENRYEGGGKREPGKFRSGVEGGRKTREEGRRRRVTNNHSRKP